MEGAPHFSLAVMSVLMAAICSVASSEEPAAAPSNPVDETAEVEVARPFELSDAEEARLNNLLTKWEQVSSKIHVYHSEFTRFDYGPGFGLDAEPRVSHGEIAYLGPSIASFWLVRSKGEVERLHRDQKVIYQIDYLRKTIAEYPVADSNRAPGSWPIPLLYDVHAVNLNRDYWIRINDDRGGEGRIWLELYPRRQPDGLMTLIRQLKSDPAHCYRWYRLDVLLDERDLKAVALRVHGPTTGYSTTFVFDDVKVGDDTFAKTMILCGFPWPPTGKLPAGWKKIIAR